MPYSGVCNQCSQLELFAQQLGPSCSQTLDLKSFISIFEAMRQVMLAFLATCVLLLPDVLGMYSKRAPPGDDVPPEKKFRINVADLFLGDDVSGSRACSLYDDAQSAGARHVQDLAKYAFDLSLTYTCVRVCFVLVMARQINCVWLHV